MSNHFIILLHHYNFSFIQQARTELEKEADSFEDSRREVQECKDFLAICEKFGPFGVIIDGLNVLGYIKNPRKVSTLN